VPVITSFTANPPTINAGGSSVLTCLATGATSVSIQGIAPVNASGSFTVTPTTTTTYTCIATNAQGSSTKQATVTVNQPTGPGGGSGGPVISVPGGPVIYTQVSAVQLDLTGTKSPTNSYPITYSTVATSGGVSVANGATAMPTITVPAINGTYTVRITATDSNKVSSTYNLTVIFVGGQIYPTGKGLPRGSSRQ
jgi:hypothetical protein